MLWLYFFCVAVPKNTQKLTPKIFCLLAVSVRAICPKTRLVEQIDFSFYDSSSESSDSDTCIRPGGMVHYVVPIMDGESGQNRFVGVWICFAIVFVGKMLNVSLFSKIKLFNEDNNMELPS